LNKKIYFGNQKSRDESKAAFIWKERRGTIEKLSTLQVKQREDESKKVS